MSHYLAYVYGPTDQEVKDVIKRVRKLEPHTAVTAIDIHN